MNVVTAQAELQSLCASAEGLSSWLQTRGFTSTESPFQVEDQTSALTWSLFKASETTHLKSPRLMVIYQEAWCQGRKVLGSQVKRLQREVLNVINAWEVSPHRAMKPSLCLVVCTSFAVLFDLTQKGASLGRRLRFTRELLSKEDRSAFKAFAHFSAEGLIGYVSEDSTPIEQLTRAQRLSMGAQRPDGALKYDFKRLFQGEALDEDFVRFMGFQRLRILKALIEPEHRLTLLTPMLQKLDPTIKAELSDELIQKLTHQLKAGLIASVDTLLLRVVLYRYLEAQFGYHPSPEEERGVSFGTTYDELIKLTTVDAPQLAEAFEEASKTFAQAQQVNLSVDQITQKKAQSSAKRRKKKKHAVPSSQDALFDLNESSTEVTQTEVFQEELKTRNDYYQRQAGGDLHHGRVSEATDVLYHFLLEYFPNAYAFFLKGTSDERYSFAYADLDPRAFQRFYENTIGTDLRLNNTSQTLEVVHWHQNRKEQGAYFTDERVAVYLVKKSIGALFDEWCDSFHRWVNQVMTPGLTLTKKLIKEAQVGLKERLDELMGWQIIDPTMGGGIFLRAAFDHLSSLHEKINLLITGLPSEVYAELFKSELYRMFSAEEESEGEWQWYVLLNMIYGVDVDVKAVNIASNLLTLSALTYKRSSLCFPSFINTNLKRGNALVVPLTDGREAFLARHKDQLIKLMELRATLRLPTTPRELWLKTMIEAEALTKLISWAEAGRTFKGAFGDISSEDEYKRIEQVGFFLYEAEFPEVFFTPEGELKERAGFAVTLGNPPWEKLAAQLKHFLPEFDPGYKKLKGKKAKEKESELLAQPHIATRWAAFQASLQDYRSLINTGYYQHQSLQTEQETTSSEGNLYRYTTELALRLTRPQGFLAMFLDNGLWGDHGSAGVRHLIFNHYTLCELYSFTNTKKRFFADVDSRQKFGCNVIRLVPSEEGAHIKAIFMREDLKELTHPEEHLIFMALSEIKKTKGYALPEVRDEAQWRAYLRLNALSSLSICWGVKTRSGDFHAGNQREFFISPQNKKEGYYPLISGAQFNLFGVHQGALPESWLDPSEEGIGGWLRKLQEGRVIKVIADWLEQKAGGGKLDGKTKKAWAWAGAQLGQPHLERLPDEWVKLDWSSYRIAWRDVTNGTNKRTLIAGILPPLCGHDHTAYSIQPHDIHITRDQIIFEESPLEQLLFKAGVLSSFACDSVARTKVSGTHLTASIFKGLSVPPYKDTPTTRRIMELTARLTCLPATKERPWADYTELAASVGLTPERDGLIDPQVRREAEIELNALVAELYEYDCADFEAMMRRLFIRNTHAEEHEEVMLGVLGRLSR